MTKSANRQGMTFIELLIAIFVFIMSMSGLISSVAAVFKLIDQSRERTVAVADLSSLMEKMRATAFDSLTASFTNGIADGPAANRYPTILGGYTLRNETITVVYPNTGTDPLEINATISWASKQGRNNSMSISTRRTR